MTVAATVAALFGTATSYADLPSSPQLAATALTVPRAPGGPAGPTRDGWQVQPDGDGGYDVSYVLEEPLPITGARPELSLDGEPLGPGLVSDDGRTVTLAGSLPAAPDVADLDVELSGLPLEGASPPGAAGAAAPPPPAPGPLLDVDPAEPGSSQVATSDYELEPLSVDRLPDVETVGHVSGPVGAGAAPVVLFLHGRHEFCYRSATRRGAYDWPCKAGQKPIPSQLGYTYVQDLLASQGFLTVSIAANGINAQDGGSVDGGAQARADLIEHHLDLLAEGALDDYLPEATTPDLDRTVLVGHSRGGEGVNRATETDAPGGEYEIVGQVLLAPTDFARQATPYVPSVTVLPFCDGDVSDLQGQLYTDIPRDLTADDPALHSSVLVMGANHNFFNTEWTPGLSAAPSFDDNSYDKGYCEDRSGDGDPRLEPDQQQDVGAVYVAGAARLFTGETDFAPLFDGSGARARTTGALDIRSQATGGLRDVLRPGLDAQPATGPGFTADAALCSGFDRSCLTRATGRELSTPHFAEQYVGDVPVRPALRVRWTGSGRAAGLTADAPLDLTDDAALDLRVLLPPQQGGDLDVRLVDGDGDAATLAPADAGRPAVLPKRRYSTTVVAQTLRVDLDTAAADPGLGAVDLDDVRTVGIVSGTGSGTAWLLDAAGVPRTTPDPGSGRAPALDVRNVTVDEGDDPDGTVEIPYRLDGPAPTGATVRVVPQVYDQGRLSPDAVDVELPAGATQGTIALPLRGDDTFGGNSRTVVAVYPVRGVATADAYAQVRVKEDEPDPTVTLRARPASVREGRRVVFVGSLDVALTERDSVRARLARGRGPVLRVGDLGREYLRRHDLLGRDPRGAALGDAFPLQADIAAGRTRFRLVLPTRTDGAREGTERVTVLLTRFGGARATATVRD